MSEIATSAAAAAATVKTSLSALDKIISTLQSARTRVKIESQELTIRVPELYGQYSVAVDVHEGKFGKFSQKLKFNLPSVKAIEVHSLGTSFLPENQAVTQTGEGFELDSAKLSAGTQTVLLTFEFEIPDTRFLYNLVRSDSGHDSTESEDSSKSEYWMAAQLKHPDALKTKFGRLDLRDIDMTVDVGVHQDVKARIPRQFVIQLETLRDIAQTRDRNKSVRLALQHIRSVRFAGREYEILQDIQELFLPTKFKSFVDVGTPYRYWDCQRGTDFYELPIPSFPKSMKVISRTNLSLDQPAANGTMIYKKSEFKDAIAKFF